MQLPFFLRRPWLIVRGGLTNRHEPDLAAMRAVDDPEEFVWAVLPHAARSFATSILVLPKQEAWAAAVAYLQCRILDTYEDLSPDISARPQLLRLLGSRLQASPPAAPPRLDGSLIRTPADEVHHLLTERVALVDEAYASLPSTERSSIAELVGRMAEGMAWAAETFAAQGGMLVDAPQRARYCHYVIGEPALYAIRSLLHLPLTEQRRQDALDVAVMIQLANVTRDIEKDLPRGIGYDGSLRGLLGATELGAAARQTIAAMRLELMREAFAGIDGYRRLVADLPPGLSQARAAAVIMLGFTDRYYAGCAARACRTAWRRRPRALIYADGLLASLSARWAERVVARTSRHFAEFAERQSQG